MTDDTAQRVDEGALRALVPRVLAGLVRRGEDFDAAEDALQEALLEALRVWLEHPPRDPQAWLATVATRRLVDARRSETARHRREEVAFEKANSVHNIIAGCILARDVESWFGNVDRGQVRSWKLGRKGNDDGSRAGAYV